MMSALKSFDRLGIFCWKERSTIQRTFDPTTLRSGGASSRQSATLEDGGVDRGGFHVPSTFLSVAGQRFVPEKFLDGVVGVVQQGDATRCLVRRALLT